MSPKIFRFLLARMGPGSCSLDQGGEVVVDLVVVARVRGGTGKVSPSPPPPGYDG